MESLLDIEGVDRGMMVRYWVVEKDVFVDGDIELPELLLGVFGIGHP